MRYIFKALSYDDKGTKLNTSGQGLYLLHTKVIIIMLKDDDRYERIEIAYKLLCTTL